MKLSQLEYSCQKKAKELIEAHVEKASTTVSDGFAMYAFLGQDDRFKHVIVDHSIGQCVNSGFHTNGIEGFWSLLKRGIIGIFHQVSPRQLQRYFDEFAARYNARKIKDHERFELSVQNSNGQMEYNQLIGKQ